MAKDKTAPFTVYGIQYLPDKKRERGEHFKRTKRLSLRRSRSKSSDHLSRNSKGSGQVLTSDKEDSRTESEISHSEESTPTHLPTQGTNSTGHSSSNHDGIIIGTITTESVTFSLPKDTDAGISPGLNNNAKSSDDAEQCVQESEESSKLLKQMNCDISGENDWLDYAYPYENIVMSGGGSKGYAYIGALRALEDSGVLSRVRRVGGSSAGAICGGLLVVGCTPQEIADVFFCNVKWLFQDQKCTCCFFLPKMWKRFGVNPGVRFSEVYGQHIARKVGNPDITFLELYRDYGKEFCVAVTNVSRMCSEYCHWTTTPDLPIRTAVRISMSFPVVYEAVKHNLFGEEHLYIDGGTLDQYPIHCFDGLQSDLNHNMETGRNKAMNEKSVGISLLSETPIDYKIWECLYGVKLDTYPPYMPKTKLAKKRLKEEIKRRKKSDPNFDAKKFISETVTIDGREEMKHYTRGCKDLNISNFGRYIKAGLSTILVSQRRLHVKPCDKERTIAVNCGYIATSDYDLEPGDREFMIRCGYEHTKTFLKNYIVSRKQTLHSSKSCGGLSKDNGMFERMRRTASSVSQYHVSRSTSGISQISRETEV